MSWRKPKSKVRRFFRHEGGPPAIGFSATIQTPSPDGFEQRSLPGSVKQGQGSQRPQHLGRRGIQRIEWAARPAIWIEGPAEPVVLGLATDEVGVRVDLLDLGVGCVALWVLARCCNLNLVCEPAPPHLQ